MRPTTVAKINEAPTLRYPGREAVNAVTRPLVEPLAKIWATNTVSRLLGFWVLWHSYGTLSGLVDAGIMSRAAAYRNRADFVQVFGCNVEDFQPVAAAAVAVAMRSSTEPVPVGDPA